MMKIKIDHVTNSSSASFVILRSNLTPLQETLIIDHMEVAEMLVSTNSPFDIEVDFGFMGRHDYWDISVYDDRIEGDTSMDNFDMLEFLRVIGVPDEAIAYDHSG